MMVIVNKEVIKQELQNLFNESLNDIMETISDDNEHFIKSVQNDEDTFLSVKIGIENKDFETNKMYQDFYKAYQLIIQEPMGGMKLDEMFWGKPLSTEKAITVPKGTVKKYIIKCRDDISDEQMDKFAKLLNERGFVMYKGDVIEDIKEIEVRE